MLSFEADISDVNAEGNLLAEDVEICKFAGLLRGATLWLCAYYVFNCSYHKSCRKTLLFLQRIILGLRDTTKVPASVLTVVKTLNDFIATNK